MAYLLGKHLYNKCKGRKDSEKPSPSGTEGGPSLTTSPNLDGPNNVSPTGGPNGSGGSRAVLWFKVKLLIALAIPVFLETLDYTIVATAQPQIASVFNRLDLQSYIGTSYLLSSTVFLPFFASVADIFGRHTGIQISLFFFLIGSAVSAGAINMAMVLVGRGIAGIGAAGLLTIVRTILSDSSSLDDNNWQVSILFLLYAIGYAVGPLLGGLLVAVSFRWVFAINLPCALVSMVLCFFLLRGNVKVGQSAHRLPTLSVEKETVLQKILRIDWVGTLFFVGGGILILLALNWGSTNEWGSARVIVSWIIGGLLFVACILWEYILEHQMFSINPSSISVLRADPMLPLEIFRSYDVSTVEYGSFISGLVMLVMFYFVSIFMTIVTGLSPAKAGVQLVYFAPGMGGGTLISIFMIRHLRQPKYPIIFGSIVITVSLGLIQMAMNFNNQNQVNGFMVMSGVGVGLTAGSLAVHARFSQPTNRVAIVNALTLFFRSLGGTVGLAQCAAVMNAKVTRYLTAQIRSGTLSASDISALAAASANGGLDSLQSLGGLPTNVQNVVRDAFRNGVRWSFISLIPWCGLAVIFTLFLSNIRDRKGENKQAETGQAKEKVSHIDSGQNISNHEQVHGEEQVAPVTGS